jgi:hypothetical protein
LRNNTVCDFASALSGFGRAALPQAWLSGKKKTTGNTEHESQTRHFHNI